MRTCLVSLLTLAPLLGLAGAAHAHIGDQIYPIFELLDEDLDRIDLTDGSVEDWLDVLGEPSLTATDFYFPDHYDPSSVDNRFWLGWHRRSGTLWVAMERFDDIYHNNFAGEVNDSGLSTMNAGTRLSPSWSTAITPADGTWQPPGPALDGDRRGGGGGPAGGL